MINQSNLARWQAATDLPTRRGDSASVIRQLVELDAVIDVCEATGLARRERGDEHAQATDVFQGGRLACGHYGEPAAHQRLADHTA